ncbi:MAG TPA: oligopeptide/dipeptide ABC transporter ATP-binding protein [Vicinamibacteria bacterium]
MSRAVTVPDSAAEPILEARDLVKRFPVRRGLLRRTVAEVHAVDGVTFSVRAGETLSLVGESGSGKTTTGRCILRLVEPTSGDIRFEGRDVLALDGPSLRKLRRKAQIVFQDSSGALNPRMTVGAIVIEPLEIHDLGTRQERTEKMELLLQMVGIDPKAASRYPHEFSGGQRQRIGIARALALDPTFLVADEPVSSLDVSVQAQILNLFVELQEKMRLSYLFIAHDLRVVKHLSDRVAVMYLGKIVEVAPTALLYQNPLHPYTQALLASVPEPDPQTKKPLSSKTLPGNRHSSPLDPPRGCRFQPRCPVAVERCRSEEPRLTEIGTAHFAACHLAAGPDS